jgi:lysozyme
MPTRVRRHITAPLTQNQFDALASLAYNAGAAPFRPDQAIPKALAKGDYASAAKAFRLWNRQRLGPRGPLVVSRGLTRRRADEITLFNKPPAP